MYIWKIEKLNEQLITGEMKESDAFKYLMANSVVYSLPMIQASTPGQYDIIEGFIGFFINVLGLWFIYKCNGGKDGKRIIERYLSISWVVFIRLSVLFIVPTAIAVFAIQEVSMGGVSEETTLIDIVFYQLFNIGYILWIAKHIHYIAKQTQPDRSGVSRSLPLS